MRSGLIGFIAGALVVLLSVLAFQLWMIRVAANDLDYRFAKYVFSDTKFPWSYLAQGRALDRVLFPVRITTKFYDAKYNEVTEAAQPGRYGAVVKISLNGGVEQYRFITLYRTPTPVFWSDGPTPTIVSAQMPPGMGIDPVVLQKQGVEIGNEINLGFFGEGDVSPKLAILLAGLSETAPGDPAAVARTNVEARDQAWWFGLRERIGLAQSYPYLVDLPHGYEADPAKKVAVDFVPAQRRAEGHRPEQGPHEWLAARNRQGARRSRRGYFAAGARRAGLEYFGFKPAAG